MKRFLKDVAPVVGKGVVTGLGAVAPGLSGSVLLVIFGLYQKTITAISSLFSDFFGHVKDFVKRRPHDFKRFVKEAWRDIAKNLLFLIPLAVGMVLGVLLFSNLVKYLLDTFPMPTRYAFLGLVLGSLPLVFKEVRKEGFRGYHYLMVAGALAVGVFIFYINDLHIPPIQNPHFLQSVLVGAVVAASYVVPGIDSATILSALGMYVLWNNSLATLDFGVLLPAAIGLIVGVIAVSLTISKLMKVCYAGTFSIIFGFFLSIIPSVLKHEELGFIYLPAKNGETVISIIALVLGVVASLLFSNLEKIKDKTEE